MAQSIKWARGAMAVALVLGGLALTSSFVNTGWLGAADGALFLAAAWWIRRGEGWAALAVAAIVTGPALLGARFSLTQLAFALLVDVLLVAGAVQLFRARPAGAKAPTAAVAWASLTIVLGWSWLVVRPMVMPTGSMEKTITSGDRLLVETVTHRLGRHPQVGEMVVFHYPVDRKQTYLKRVVAVAGDRIRFENKQLYRNGNLVAEPYAIHLTDYVDPYRDQFPNNSEPVHFQQASDMMRDHVQNGEVVVPQGMLFVLGDNRDNSLDSRYWGFVPESDVIGRPLVVYSSAAHVFTMRCPQ